MLAVRSMKLLAGSLSHGLNLSSWQSRRSKTDHEVSGSANTLPGIFHYLPNMSELLLM